MFKKITLIQCPIHNEDTSNVFPPLGLLSLASYVRNNGFGVSIIDLNMKGLSKPGWVDSDRFFPDVIEEISKEKCSLVGITSMALDSPVALELANYIKEHDPSVSIVLGGPHFSAIALDLLSKFECVDYVVCGEGELPLLKLMKRGRVTGGRHQIENLAERTPFGPQLQRSSASALTLDELPLPAYDLVDVNRYFDLDLSKTIPYDHQRGCVLRCSFCYSKGHWGQGNRAKSPQKIISDLKELMAYKPETIFFVGDNFLNDISYASALCNALFSAKFNVDYFGYATLAQLDKPMVRLLGKARFKGVFIGVDALSGRTKKEFKKTYYKSWEKLEETLRFCIKNGVKPTCGLMLSPDYSNDELEKVIETAIRLENMRVDVRLNHLSYYNGTEMTRKMFADQFRYSSAVGDILMETPQRVRKGVLAKKAPMLFPYHNLVMSDLVEKRILLLTRYAFILVQVFTVTLLKHLKRDGGGILSLIEETFESFSAPEEYSRYVEAKIICQHFVKTVMSKNNAEMISDLQYELQYAEIITGNEFGIP